MLDANTAGATTPRPVADKPLNFNAAQVRKILDGSMTQARIRLRVQPPEWVTEMGWTAFTPKGKVSGRGKWEGEPAEKFLPGCPYYAPGSSPCRLWVRESHAAEELVGGADGVRYFADNAWLPIANTQEAAEQWLDLRNYRTKDPRPEGHSLTDGGIRFRTVPPTLMPRWASRVTLPLVEVRVERLQDISEEDAKAEGVDCDSAAAWWDAVGSGGDPYRAAVAKGYRAAFRELWGRINGPESWDANPWVWVLRWETREVRNG